MKEEKHVLVVEDDVDLCMTIVETLKRNGFNAYGCTAPRDALLKMKNQTYHCILLDMRLGLDSGEDLIDIIRTRKDAMNMKTPIYVISGHLEKDMVGRVAKSIQGALVKPFEMASLLALVEKQSKKS